ncbi:glycosyltransferase [Acetobacter conturbans]|uniref:Glycosyltransferase n=1 Tax=Acetobacter conturbans TaxID=1737472 RepID=A0ABX0JYL8_9PROT|nr:glycosyltransferase [Acetobacter conturbans]NHN87972.1 glycosyltransferase [Acetobacter conturbans]
MTPPYAVTARPAELPGYLDITTRTRIAGWAQAAGGAGEAVALQVLDNGVPIARVIANQHRHDLAQAGFGDGRHGFDLLIPAALSLHERHVIQVRRESDGSELIGSPVVIEASGAFDEDLRQVVRQAARGTLTNEGREDILAFLADVASEVLDDHARADGRQDQRERYHRLTRRHGPSQTEEPCASRALIIDERLPVMGRDAGSQALLSHARALRALGYDVSLVAADDLTPPAAVCDVLEREGFTVWRSPYYASVEDILRRQGHAFDVVYLHRIGVASRYLALARHLQPSATVLYSVADLHNRRLEGQATIEVRPEVQALSRAIRLQECTAAWQADAVLTHSPEEAVWLQRTVPDARVACVPWAVPIRPDVADFPTRRDIAFIGNYHHAPNLDAVRWFVETVLPLLHAAEPSLRLWLVGPHLPPHLHWPESVRVMGHVNDLDADVLAHVRLTVAPLRFGAGIKGKVLESFAAGVPCVMTPVAAAGLDLPPDLASLVAEGAEAFAACIAALYADPARCQVCGRLGQIYVSTAFSEEKVLDTLGRAIAMARLPR